MKWTRRVASWMDARLLVGIGALALVAACSSSGESGSTGSSKPVDDANTPAAQADGQPSGASDEAEVARQAPAAERATAEEAAMVEAALAKQAAQGSLAHQHAAPLDEAAYSDMLNKFEHAETPRDRQMALVKYMRAIQGLGEQERAQRTQALLTVQARVLEAQKGGQ